MCISWKIECLMLLLHGATMKFEVTDVQVTRCDVRWSEGEVIGWTDSSVWMIPVISRSVRFNRYRNIGSVAPTNLSSFQHRTQFCNPNSQTCAWENENLNKVSKCVSHGYEISSLITNKTGTVRINITLRRIRQPLFPWKSNKNCIFRVFLALGIYSAMRMHHIVICGLSGFTEFFHIS